VSTSPSYPVNAATLPGTPWRQIPGKSVGMLPWPGTLAVRHLMTLSIAKGKHPLVALLGLMAVSLAILPLLPPILQDPS